MKLTNQKLTWLAACAALLFATGCNNNSKGSTVTQQNRAGVAAASTFVFPVTGGYSLGTGRLFLTGQYASMMTVGMKNLLSAYIDPANVGDVDGANGVTFRGYVDLSNGNVNTTTSGLEIEIRDSYAVKGTNDNGETIAPLKFGAAASSYTYNASTGVARVAFRTTGAEYVFEGYLDQNNFTGAFSYQNSTSFSSAEPVHAGNNIQFQIATCQFFKCN